MLNKVLWMVAIASMSPGAWAVMKCTGSGKTWYQDAPCPQGTTGTQMQLAAPPAGAPTVPPAVHQQETALPPPVADARPPAPPAGAAPSVLDSEAQMCLAWYQKQVPLASSTQYVSATRDGRVLTIVISIPVSVVNHTGARVEGTTETPAPCEIHAGRLDDGWTRIHAKRSGWIQ